MKNEIIFQIVLNSIKKFKNIFILDGADRTRQICKYPNVKINKI